MRDGAVLDRRNYVLERIGETDTGCWQWQPSTGSHGYGNAYNGTTVVLAHRMSFEAFRGPILNDLTVDHICRNRTCVNPAHMRLMANLDNAKDNGMSSRTHCPHGHAYDDENTYRCPTKGHRRCRACAKARRNI